MLGATKIYGCLADPIDHVKAPTIFTSIFKEKNIDAVMIPIHVEKDNLKNILSSLKKIKNFQGMTVTIPHKTTIANFCDHLEQDAEFTKSVNWIKFDKDRKLIGNNLDGQGFVAGFLSQNFLIKNKKICIFGAGGAAVSIACSLAKQKIKSLKIINRNIDKAHELMKKIKVLDQLSVPDSPMKLLALEQKLYLYVKANDLENIKLLLKLISSDQAITPEQVSRIKEVESMYELN